MLAGKPVFKTFAMSSAPLLGSSQVDRSRQHIPSVLPSVVKVAANPCEALFLET